MNTATVLGRGVAGLCCARLLAREGVPVRLIGRPPTRAPVLLLNDVTVALIEDLFDGDPTLLAGAHRLEERRVLWGPDEDNTVPSIGFAIDGCRLMQRLVQHLARGTDGHVTLDETLDLADPAARAELLKELPGDHRGKAEWVFDATGRRAELSRVRLRAGMGPVGHRTALAAVVPLASSVDETVCTIETVSEGWMFLLPLGSGRALLQGIVPEIQGDRFAAMARLLGQARAIPTLIAASPEYVFAFDAWPGLTDPPGAPGWLALGDAAVAFDPLCGDGTGQAIRCAILAVAVSMGSAAGEAEAACLQHYGARLRLTFLAHLQACQAFYEPAFFSPLWCDEIAVTKRAIEELEQ